jgi:hypothetical protein
MPSFPIVIDTQFAENVSTKGNRCGVTFSPPLQIPANANPRLRLYSSSIAYNFPNVSAELENNTLHIERIIGQIVHMHLVSFETGLYGTLDDIQQVIKHSINQDPMFSDLTIRLVGVAATQKAHIEVTNDLADIVKLSFTASRSIGPLLGFTSDRLFSPYATGSEESDTTASLDRTTSVLVQTSMCSGSVVAGKGGQSTLAVIHLAAFSPASVIAYSPSNMLEVPAPNLAGASVTNATFALVNQNNEDLDTLNEEWTLVVEVVW